eukprot:TRINITY_DN10758_c0_g1_i1.p1 TRINITY_DN10758_c0_g1~~TRINITY_DN10758_c0_g1_i1.p1  ORF type:complete len:159 (+),score=36.76 TRINITY_DN10758_c0_g1_i1:45-479(+)
MLRTVIFAALFGSVVSQSYAGNYYRLQLEKDTSIWTIHGLWPEWGQDCRKVTFNETVLKPILPQLEEYWPSDQGSDATFWQHEWEKHGSCADNMDEFTYFNTTLTLYHANVHLCPSSGTACFVCFTRTGMQRCDCTSSTPGKCA